jgi:hypothetical protein
MTRGSAASWRAAAGDNSTAILASPAALIYRSIRRIDPATLKSAG